MSAASGSKTRRAAARPAGRLEQRRERILKEAERLFLQRGYAGASINEIARLAGGSLATLYGEFGSKEGLFAGIMRARARSVFDSTAAQCPRSRGRRAGLVQLATRLLERILREDSLALYRIAISEGPRFAELRKAIIEVSFPAFIDSLGAALVQLGVATAAKRSAAAEEFISLVHGQLVFRAACGGGRTISARQRARHIERAVDAFLVLHARRDTDRGWRAAGK